MRHENPNPPLAHHEDSLASLILDVQAAVLASCERSRFDPTLRELMADTAREFFARSGTGDFAQPLGLYFSSYRSLGKSTDEVTRLVGEFLCFYLFAGDAFDDVEDGDSARKPFGRRGVPVATNTALMFIVLGLDALGKAIQLSSSPSEGARLLRVFNEVSLTGVSAQHVDLMGNLKTRSDILELHEGKASSLALLTECGAVVAGAPEEVAVAYRKIGFKLAQIVQIVDDVRDVFGVDVSSDLRDNKATYPLFCLREILSAEQLETYQELLSVSDTESGLAQIRSIYHESGSIDMCADKVEDLRQDVHTLVSGLPESSAYHRLLLEIVDALAGTLYEAEQLEVSQEVRSSSGPFARRLLAEARRFVDQSGVWGDAECPTLRPWHLPFFLFSPSSRSIYFPDLDGLPAEILPFYAQLLGTSLGDVQELLPCIAPFFVAHELVHARRFDLGLLSDDTWHEEVLADAVALRYVQKANPEVAESLMGYVARLLRELPPTPALRDEALSLLHDGLGGPRPEGGDYGHSALESAQIHAIFLEQMPNLDDSALRSLTTGAPVLPAQIVAA